MGVDNSADIMSAALSKSSNVSNSGATGSGAHPNSLSNNLTAKTSDVAFAIEIIYAPNASGCCCESIANVSKTSLTSAQGSHSRGKSGRLLVSSAVKKSMRSCSDHSA